MTPLLPTPAAHLADGLPLFTESQLLAYRAEVIEMCAAVCQSRIRTVRSGHTGASYRSHDPVSVSAEILTEEIRKLK